MQIRQSIHSPMLFDLARGFWKLLIEPALKNRLQLDSSWNPNQIRPTTVLLLNIYRKTTVSVI